MSYDQCERCGHWDFTDEHQCPPQWRVRVEGYHFEEGQDPLGSEGGFLTAYARNQEGAATEAFERHESDCGMEGTILDGSHTARVVVTTPDDTELKWFVMTGEMVPSYSATSERPETILAENELRAVLAAENPELPWKASFEGFEVTVGGEMPGYLMMYVPNQVVRFWRRVLEQVLGRSTRRAYTEDVPLPGIYEESADGVQFCLKAPPQMPERGSCDVRPGCTYRKGHYGDCSMEGA